jgi:hypothetical protein
MYIKFEELGSYMFIQISVLCIEISIPITTTMRIQPYSKCGTILHTFLVIKLKV